VGRHGGQARGSSWARKWVADEAGSWAGPGQAPRAGHSRARRRHSRRSAPHGSGPCRGHARAAPQAL